MTAVGVQAEERMVQVDDGCYLWTVETGTGTPVVFCHGGPGMQDYLAPLAEMVEDHCRVIRWDQRGAGRSTHTGPFTVERFVADLDRLRAAYGLETWIVGGHSFGATIALAYALEHPERTEALIYLDGTGLGRSWEARYRENCARRLGPTLRVRLEQLKALATRSREQEDEYRKLAWGTDFADTRNALQLAAALLHSQDDINYAANAELMIEVKAWNQKAMKRRCSELTMPTLVVHGGADPRPTSALDSLVGSLPDPQVHILPDVGHFPWIERPWLLGRVLREFLHELGTPANAG